MELARKPASATNGGEIDPSATATTIAAALTLSKQTTWSITTNTGSGQLDNVPCTTGYLRFTGAVTSVTGIQAPAAEGAFLMIECEGGTTVKFLPANAGSLAANRFQTGTNLTFTCKNGAALAMVYAGGRWCLLSPDIEEDVFTPVLSFTTGNGTASFTGTPRTFYKRVNHMVTFTTQVTINKGDRTTQQPRWTMPYTAEALLNYMCNVRINGVQIPTNKMVSLNISNGQNLTEVSFFGGATPGVANVTVTAAELGTSTDWIVTGHYYIAS